MIDLRKKRQELIDASARAQETIVKLTEQRTFLHGGITLLNELIAEEEKDTPNAQSDS